jgi:hypothetical protein
VVYHFDGTISAVQVSQSARYTQAFAPPTDLAADEKTLALYRFDEGRGDELKDSSGNNHHGKIVGAKWGMVEAPAVVAPKLNSLEFDGVDDYVDIPSLTYADPSRPICFEAWGVPHKADAIAHVITVHGPTTLAIHQNAGRLFSNRIRGTGREFIRHEPTRIVPGTRAHWAVSWDGARQRFFVDGKMIDQVIRAQPEAFSAQGSVIAAARTPGSDLKHFFPGNIDNIRVSSATRYTADFTPETRYKTTTRPWPCIPSTKARATNSRIRPATTTTARSWERSGYESKSKKSFSATPENSDVHTPDDAIVSGLGDTIPTCQASDNRVMTRR